jgi:thiamine-monophosphate kinase
MAGELDFIARLRVLASHPAARGLDDDCAVLPLGSETLILTHDAMAQGVHYLPDQDMADVAWKLVATNLSDLAAKGAQPLGVLLGYALGKTGSGDDERFLAGLAQALDHYATPLLGGDTIRVEGPRSFGLTAIGRATHTPVPSRSGAQVGDGLWITGPVGAAMMGLEALRMGDATPEASLAYRRPQALLAQGQALAPLVSAMMDVSDGLLLDAWRMGVASGVTIALDGAAVPLTAPEGRRDEALRWGDDYQLLFAAPYDAHLPVPATRIGMVQAQGAAPLMLDGMALNDPARLGWSHAN